MSSRKYRIGTYVQPELKEAVEAAAASVGITVSEYLRLAAINLVNERTVPFKVLSSGTPPRGWKPGRPRKAA